MRKKFGQKRKIVRILMSPAFNVRKVKPKKGKGAPYRRHTREGDKYGDVCGLR